MRERESKGVVREGEVSVLKERVVRVVVVVARIWHGVHGAGAAGASEIIERRTVQAATARVRDSRGRFDLSRRTERE